MRVLIIVLLIGLSAWLAKERFDLKEQNAALENSAAELKKKNAALDAKIAELSGRPPQIIVSPSAPPPPPPPAPKAKTWMDEKLEQAGKALDQPPRSGYDGNYRPPSPGMRPIR